MLVEDGLKGKAFPTNMAVEGFIPSVLADVVFQLVLPCVLLPTYAAHKWCDAHVQTHVSVKTSLLVEGLAAVDAGKAWVIAEPAITHLLPQILFIASHVKDGLLLTLGGNARGFKYHKCWELLQYKVFSNTKMDENYPTNHLKTLLANL